jgi:hypothetical protein
MSNLVTTSFSSAFHLAHLRISLPSFPRAKSRRITPKFQLLWSADCWQLDALAEQGALDPTPIPAPNEPAKLQRQLQAYPSGDVTSVPLSTPAPSIVSKEESEGRLLQLMRHLVLARTRSEVLGLLESQQLKSSDMRRLVTLLDKHGRPEVAWRMLRCLGAKRLRHSSLHLRCDWLCDCQCIFACGCIWICVEHIELHRNLWHEG